VSEPGEEEGDDGDCADLGVASVDLSSHRGHLDQAVLDVRDESDGVVIGQLVLLPKLPDLHLLQLPLSQLD